MRDCIGVAEDVDDYLVTNIVVVRWRYFSSRSFSWYIAWGTFELQLVMFILID